MRAPSRRGRTGCPATWRAGFTLIEILVVVAIIALLIAILLPSLARSRAQARNIVCQSNMRQLATAFLAYSSAWKGRLPGDEEAGADWLGSKSAKGAPHGGVIWKYMGGQVEAYKCPDHNPPRAGGDWIWSYSFTVLLSGAPTDVPTGAHYGPINDFDSTDHADSAIMRRMDGVPMLVEEDEHWYLKNISNALWAGLDCVTDRHLKTGSGSGSGNIAYLDGHVGGVKLPPAPPSASYDTWKHEHFHAESFCVRTRGNKWISGRQAVEDGDGFGQIMRHPPAFLADPPILHVNDPQ